jgi:hypothetical protein
MIDEEEFLEFKERCAKAYRLPVIRDLHPDRSYVAALVLFEPEDHFATAIGTIQPTEDEAELLGLYIQYRNERWLKPSFIRQMKESDSVDIDPGVNTYLFFKSAHRGWLYRMNTWTTGPLVIPNYDSEDRFTLLELLDKQVIARSGETDPLWEKFKKDNYIFHG